ncbi:synaptonemal complex protein 1 [Candidatus Fokinia crypta]|uniref:Uncharacterized protein n=1 Tax=Candidatus Fokinia crypta TaxID=1920990 RepID=A0ABZ0UQS2_9RICK|nr:hypothetical protein [Candidatus Fokinia cryptica]WPX98059.1 hypothetical protein Fokcrypt_00587 [Candidatus Fokinia cryptica]
MTKRNNQFSSDTNSETSTNSGTSGTASNTSGLFMNLSNLFSSESLISDIIKQYEKAGLDIELQNSIPMEDIVLIKYVKGGRKETISYYFVIRDTKSDAYLVVDIGNKNITPWFIDQEDAKQMETLKYTKYTDTALRDRIIEGFQKYEYLNLKGSVDIGRSPAYLAKIAFEDAGAEFIDDEFKDVEQISGASGMGKVRLEGSEIIHDLASEFHIRKELKSVSCHMLFGAVQSSMVVKFSTEISKDLYLIFDRDNRETFKVAVVSLEKGTVISMDERPIASLGDYSEEELKQGGNTVEKFWDVGFWEKAIKRQSYKFYDFNIELGDVYFSDPGFNFDDYSSELSKLSLFQGSSISSSTLSKSFLRNLGYHKVIKNEFSKFADEVVKIEGCYVVNFSQRNPIGWSLNVKLSDESEFVIIFNKETYSSYRITDIQGQREISVVTQNGYCGSGRLSTDKEGQYEVVSTMVRDESCGRLSSSDKVFSVAMQTDEESLSSLEFIKSLFRLDEEQSNAGSSDKGTGGDKGDKENSDVNFEASSTNSTSSETFTNSTSSGTFTNSTNSGTSSNSTSSGTSSANSGTSGTNSGNSDINFEASSTNSTSSETFTNSTNSETFTNSTNSGTSSNSTSSGTSSANSGTNSGNSDINFEASSTNSTNSETFTNSTSSGTSSANSGTSDTTFNTSDSYLNNLFSKSLVMEIIRQYRKRGDDKAFASMEDIKFLKYTKEGSEEKVSYYIMQNLRAGNYCMVRIGDDGVTPLSIDRRYGVSSYETLKYSDIGDKDEIIENFRKHEYLDLKGSYDIEKLHHELYRIAFHDGSPEFIEDNFRDMDPTIESLGEKLGGHSNLHLYAGMYGIQKELKFTSCHMIFGLANSLVIIKFSTGVSKDLRLIIQRDEGRFFRLTLTTNYSKDGTTIKYERITYGALGVGDMERFWDIDFWEKARKENGFEISGVNVDFGDVYFSNDVYFPDVKKTSIDIVYSADIRYQRLLSLFQGPSLKEPTSFESFSMGIRYHKIIADVIKEALVHSRIFDSRPELKDYNVVKLTEHGKSIGWSINMKYMTLRDEHRLIFLFPDEGKYYKAYHVSDRGVKAISDGTTYEGDLLSYTVFDEINVISMEVEREQLEKGKRVSNKLLINGEDDKIIAYIIRKFLHTNADELLKVVKSYHVAALTEHGEVIGWNVNIKFPSSAYIFLFHNEQKYYRVYRIDNENNVNGVVYGSYYKGDLLAYTPFGKIAATSMEVDRKLLEAPEILSDEVVINLYRAGEKQSNSDKDAQKASRHEELMKGIKKELFVSVLYNKFRKSASLERDDLSHEYVFVEHTNSSSGEKTKIYVLFEIFLLISKGEDIYELYLVTDIEVKFIGLEEISSSDLGNFYIASRPLTTEYDIISSADGKRRIVSFGLGYISQEDAQQSLDIDSETFDTNSKTSNANSNSGSEEELNDEAMLKKIIAMDSKFSKSDAEEFSYFIIKSGDIRIVVISHVENFGRMAQSESIIGILSKDSKKLYYVDKDSNVQSYENNFILDEISKFVRQYNYEVSIPASLIANYKMLSAIHELIHSEFTQELIDERVSKIEKEELVEKMWNFISSTSSSEFGVVVQKDYKVIKYNNVKSNDTVHVVIAGGNDSSQYVAMVFGKSGKVDCHLVTKYKVVKTAKVLYSEEIVFTNQIDVISGEASNFGDNVIVGFVKAAADRFFSTDHLVWLINRKPSIHTLDKEVSDALKAADATFILENIKDVKYYVVSDKQLALRLTLNEYNGDARDVYLVFERSNKEGFYLVLPDKIDDERLDKRLVVKISSKHSADIARKFLGNLKDIVNGDVKKFLNLDVSVNDVYYKKSGGLDTKNDIISTGVAQYVKSNVLLKAITSHVLNISSFTARELDEQHIDFYKILDKVIAGKIEENIDFASLQYERVKLIVGDVEYDVFVANIRENKKLEHLLFVIEDRSIKLFAVDNSSVKSIYVTPQYDTLEVPSDIKITNTKKYTGKIKFPNDNDNGYLYANKLMQLTKGGEKYDRIFELEQYLIWSEEISEEIKNKRVSLLETFNSADSVFQELRGKSENPEVSFLKWVVENLRELLNVEKDIYNKIKLISPELEEDGGANVALIQGLLDSFSEFYNLVKDKKSFKNSLSSTLYGGHFDLFKKLFNSTTNSEYDLYLKKYTELEETISSHKASYKQNIANSSIGSDLDRMMKSYFSTAVELANEHRTKSLEHFAEKLKGEAEAKLALIKKYFADVSKVELEKISIARNKNGSESLRYFKNEADVQAIQIKWIQDVKKLCANVGVCLKDEIESMENAMRHAIDDFIMEIKEAKDFLKLLKTAKFRYEKVENIQALSYEELERVREKSKKGGKQKGEVRYIAEELINEGTQELAQACDVIRKIGERANNFLHSEIFFTDEKCVSVNDTTSIILGGNMVEAKKELLHEIIQGVKQYVEMWNKQSESFEKAKNNIDDQIKYVEAKKILKDLKEEFYVTEKEFFEKVKSPSKLIKYVPDYSDNSTIDNSFSNVFRSYFYRYLTLANEKIKPFLDGSWWKVSEENYALYNEMKSILAGALIDDSIALHNEVAELINDLYPNVVEVFGNEIESEIKKREEATIKLQQLIQGCNLEEEKCLKEEVDEILSEIFRNEKMVFNATGHVTELMISAIQQLFMKIEGKEKFSKILKIVDGISDKGAIGSVLWEHSISRYIPEIEQFSKKAGDLEVTSITKYVWAAAESELLNSKSEAEQLAELVVIEDRILQYSEDVLRINAKLIDEIYEIFAKNEFFSKDNKDGYNTSEIKKAFNNERLRLIDQYDLVNKESSLLESINDWMSNYGTSDAPEIASRISKIEAIHSSQIIYNNHIATNLGLDVIENFTLYISHLEEQKSIVVDSFKIDIDNEYEKNLSPLKEEVKKLNSIGVALQNSSKLDEKGDKIAKLESELQKFQKEFNEKQESFALNFAQFMNGEFMKYLIEPSFELNSKLFEYLQKKCNRETEEVSKKVQKLHDFADYLQEALDAQEDLHISANQQQLHLNLLEEISELSEVDVILRSSNPSREQVKLLLSKVKDIRDEFLETIKCEFEEKEKIFYFILDKKIKNMSDTSFSKEFLEKINNDLVSYKETLDKTVYKDVDDVIQESKKEFDVAKYVAHVKKLQKDDLLSKELTNFKKVLIQDLSATYMIYVWFDRANVKAEQYKHRFADDNKLKDYEKLRELPYFSNDNFGNNADASAAYELVLEFYDELRAFNDATKELFGIAQSFNELLDYINTGKDKEDKVSNLQDLLRFNARIDKSQMINHKLYIDALEREKSAIAEWTTVFNNKINAIEKELNEFLPSAKIQDLSLKNTDFIKSSNVSLEKTTKLIDQKLKELYSKVEIREWKENSSKIYGKFEKAVIDASVEELFKNLKSQSNDIVIHLKSYDDVKSIFKSFDENVKKMVALEKQGILEASEILGQMKKLRTKMDDFLLTQEKDIISIMKDIRMFYNNVEAKVTLEENVIKNELSVLLGKCNRKISLVEQGDVMELTAEEEYSIASKIDSAKKQFSDLLERVKEDVKRIGNRKYFDKSISDERIQKLVEELIETYTDTLESKIRTSVVIELNDDLKSSYQKLLHLKFKNDARVLLMNYLEEKEQIIWKGVRNGKTDLDNELYLKYVAIFDKVTILEGKFEKNLKKLGETLPNSELYQKFDEFNKIISPQDELDILRKRIAQEVTEKGSEKTKIAFAVLSYNLAVKEWMEKVLASGGKPLLSDMLSICNEAGSRYILKGIFEFEQFKRYYNGATCSATYIEYISENGEMKFFDVSGFLMNSAKTIQEIVNAFVQRKNSINLGLKSDWLVEDKDILRNPSVLKELLLKNAVDGSEVYEVILGVIDRAIQHYPLIDMTFVLGIAERILRDKLNKDFEAVSALMKDYSVIFAAENHEEENAIFEQSSEILKDAWNDQRYSRDAVILQDEIERLYYYLKEDKQSYHSWLYREDQEICENLLQTLQEQGDASDRAIKNLADLGILNNRIAEVKNALVVWFSSDRKEAALDQLFDVLWSAADGGDRYREYVMHEEVELYKRYVQKVYDGNLTVAKLVNDVALGKSGKEYKYEPISLEEKWICAEVSKKLNALLSSYKMWKEGTVDSNNIWEDPLFLVVASNADKIALFTDLNFINKLVFRKSVLQNEYLDRINGEFTFIREKLTNIVPDKAAKIIKETEQLKKILHIIEHAFHYTTTEASSYISKFISKAKQYTAENATINVDDVLTVIVGSYKENEVAISVNESDREEINQLHKSLRQLLQHKEAEIVKYLAPALTDAIKVDNITLDSTFTVLEEILDENMNPSFSERFTAIYNTLMNDEAVIDFYKLGEGKNLIESYLNSISQSVFDRSMRDEMLNSYITVLKDRKNNTVRLLEDFNKILLSIDVGAVRDNSASSSNSKSKKDITKFWKSLYSNLSKGNIFILKYLDNPEIIAEKFAPLTEGHKEYIIKLQKAVPSLVKSTSFLLEKEEKLLESLEAYKDAIYGKNLIQAREELLKYPLIKEIQPLSYYSKYEALKYKFLFNEELMTLSASDAFAKLESGQIRKNTRAEFIEVINDESIDEIFSLISRVILGYRTSVAVFGVDSSISSIISKLNSSFALPLLQEDKNRTPKDKLLADALRFLFEHSGENSSSIMDAVISASNSASMGVRNFITDVIGSMSKNYEDTAGPSKHSINLKIEELSKGLDNLKKTISNSRLYSKEIERFFIGVKAEISKELTNFDENARLLVEEVIHFETQNTHIAGMFGVALGKGDRSVFQNRFVNYYNLATSLKKLNLPLEYYKKIMYEVLDWTMGLFYHLDLREAEKAIERNTTSIMDGDKNKISSIAELVFGKAYTKNYSLGDSQGKIQTRIKELMRQGIVVRELEKIHQVANELKILKEYLIQYDESSADSVEVKLESLGKPEKLRKVISDAHLRLEWFGEGTKEGDLRKKWWEAFMKQCKVILESCEMGRYMPFSYIVEIAYLSMVNDKGYEKYGAELKRMYATWHHDIDKILKDTKNSSDFGDSVDVKLEDIVDKGSKLALKALWKHVGETINGIAEQEFVTTEFFRNELKKVLPSHLKIKEVILDLAQNVFSRYARSDATVKEKIDFFVGIINIFLPVATDEGKSIDINALQEIYGGKLSIQILEEQLLSLVEDLRKISTTFTETLLQHDSSSRLFSEAASYMKDINKSFVTQLLEIDENISLSKALAAETFKNFVSCSLRKGNIMKYQDVPNSDEKQRIEALLDEMKCVEWSDIFVSERLSKLNIKYIFDYLGTKLNSAPITQFNDMTAAYNFLVGDQVLVKAFGTENLQSIFNKFREYVTKKLNGESKYVGEIFVAFMKDKYASFVTDAEALKLLEGEKSKEFKNESESLLDITLKAAREEHDMKGMEDFAKKHLYYHEILPKCFEGIKISFIDPSWKEQNLESTLRSNCNRILKENGENPKDYKEVASFVSVIIYDIQKSIGMNKVIGGEYHSKIVQNVVEYVLYDGNLALDEGVLSVAGVNLITVLAKNLRYSVDELRAGIKQATGRMEELNATKVALSKNLEKFEKILESKDSFYGELIEFPRMKKARKDCVESAVQNDSEMMKHLKVVINLGLVQAKYKVKDIRRNNFVTKKNFPSLTPQELVKLRESINFLQKYEKHHSIFGDNVFYKSFDKLYNFNSDTKYEKHHSIFGDNVFYKSFDKLYNFNSDTKSFDSMNVWGKFTDTEKSEKFTLNDMVESEEQFLRASLSKLHTEDLYKVLDKVKVPGDGDRRGIIFNFLDTFRKVLSFSKVNGKFQNLKNVDLSVALTEMIKNLTANQIASIDLSSVDIASFFAALGDMKGSITNILLDSDSNLNALSNDQVQILLHAIKISYEAKLLEINNNLTGISYYISYFAPPDVAKQKASIENKIDDVVNNIESLRDDVFRIFEPKIEKLFLLAGYMYEHYNDAEDRAAILQTKSTASLIDTIVKLLLKRQAISQEFAKEALEIMHLFESIEKPYNDVYHSKYAETLNFTDGIKNAIINSVLGLTSKDQILLKNVMRTDKCSFMDLDPNADLEKITEEDKLKHKAKYHTDEVTLNKKMLFNFFQHFEVFGNDILTSENITNAASDYISQKRKSYEELMNSSENAKALEVEKEIKELEKVLDMLKSFDRDGEITKRIYAIYQPASSSELEESSFLIDGLLKEYIENMSDKEASKLIDSIVGLSYDMVNEIAFKDINQEIGEMQKKISDLNKSIISENDIGAFINNFGPEHIQIRALQLMSGGLRELFKEDNLMDILRNAKIKDYYPNLVTLFDKMLSYRNNVMEDMPDFIKKMKDGFYGLIDAIKGVQLFSESKFDVDSLKANSDSLRHFIRYLDPEKGIQFSEDTRTEEALRKVEMKLISIKAQINDELVNEVKKLPINSTTTVSFDMSSTSDEIVFSNNIIKEQNPFTRDLNLSSSYNVNDLFFNKICSKDYEGRLEIVDIARNFSSEKKSYEIHLERKEMSAESVAECGLDKVPEFATNVTKIMTESNVYDFPKYRNLENDSHKLTKEKEEKIFSDIVKNITLLEEQSNKFTDDIKRQLQEGTITTNEQIQKILAEDVVYSPVIKQNIQKITDGCRGIMVRCNTHGIKEIIAAVEDAPQSIFKSHMRAISIASVLNGHLLKLCKGYEKDFSDKLRDELVGKISTVKEAFEIFTVQEKWRLSLEMKLFAIQRGIAQQDSDVSNAKYRNVVEEILKHRADEIKKIKDFEDYDKNDITERALEIKRLEEELLNTNKVDDVELISKIDKLLLSFKEEYQKLQLTREYYYTTYTKKMSEIASSKKTEFTALLSRKLAPLNLHVDSSLGGSDSISATDQALYENLKNDIKNSNTDKYSEQQLKEFAKKNGLQLFSPEMIQAVASVYVDYNIEHVAYRTNSRRWDKDRKDRAVGKSKKDIEKFMSGALFGNALNTGTVQLDQYIVEKHNDDMTHFADFFTNLYSFVNESVEEHIVAYEFKTRADFGISYHIDDLKQSVESVIPELVKSYLGDIKQVLNNRLKFFIEKGKSEVIMAKYENIEKLEKRLNQIVLKLVSSYEAKVAAFVREQSNVIEECDKAVDKLTSLEKAIDDLFSNESIVKSEIMKNEEWSSSRSAYINMLDSIEHFKVALLFVSSNSCKVVSFGNFDDSVRNYVKEFSAILKEKADRIKSTKISVRNGLESKKYEMDAFIASQDYMKAFTDVETLLKNSMEHLNEGILKISPNIINGSIKLSPYEALISVVKNTVEDSSEYELLEELCSSKSMVSYSDRCNDINARIADFGINVSSSIRGMATIVEALYKDALNLVKSKKDETIYNIGQMKMRTEIEMKTAENLVQDMISGIRGVSLNVTDINFNIIEIYEKFISAFRSRLSNDIEKVINDVVNTFTSRQDYASLSRAVAFDSECKKFMESKKNIEYVKGLIRSRVQNHKDFDFAGCVDDIKDYIDKNITIPFTYRMTEKDFSSVQMVYDDTLQFFTVFCKDQNTLHKDVEKAIQYKLSATTNDMLAYSAIDKSIIEQIKHSFIEAVKIVIDDMYRGIVHSNTNYMKYSLAYWGEKFDGRAGKVFAVNALKKVMFSIGTVDFVKNIFSTENTRDSILLMIDKSHGDNLKAINDVLVEYGLGQSLDEKSTCMSIIESVLEDFPEQHAITKRCNDLQSQYSAKKKEVEAIYNAIAYVAAQINKHEELLSKLKEENSDSVEQFIDKASSIMQQCEVEIVAFLNSASLHNSIYSAIMKKFPTCRDNLAKYPNHKIEMQEMSKHDFFEEESMLIHYMNAGVIFRHGVHECSAVGENKFVNGINVIGSKCDEIIPISNEYIDTVQRLVYRALGYCSSKRFMGEDDIITAKKAYIFCEGVNKIPPEALKDFSRMSYYREESKKMKDVSELMIQWNEAIDKLVNNGIYKIDYDKVKASFIAKDTCSVGLSDAVIHNHKNWIKDTVSTLKEEEISMRFMERGDDLYTKLYDSKYFCNNDDRYNDFVYGTNDPALCDYRITKNEFFVFVMGGMDYFVIDRDELNKIDAIVGETYLEDMS